MAAPTADGELGDLEQRNAIANCSFLELDFGGAGGLNHPVELFGPGAEVWDGPFCRDVVFQRWMTRLEHMGKGQRLWFGRRCWCSWFGWRSGGREAGGAPGWKMVAGASERWTLGGEL